MPGDPYIIEDFVIPSEVDGVCILIENSNDYFIIRNCTVYNPYTNLAVPPNQVGIKLFNIANGNVLNNSCFENRESGLYIKNSKNVNISRNVLRFNGYGGICMEKSNNTIILNNTINNNDVAGIKASSCKDSIIIDNNINENGWGESSWAYGYDGLYLTLCDNFKIHNNQINENTGYGIYLSGGDNKIANNTLNENAFDGVRITGQNTSIINNFIIADEYGIYLSGSNHTLQENSMYECGLGISGNIDDLKTLIIDTSNQINNKILYFYVNQRALSSTNFSNAGQVILVNSSKCQVNNIDISNGTIGFLIYNCEEITISNSDASNNMLYGILVVNNCKNITLRQNTANNNGEIGIKIESANYTTVIGNYINNNDRYGISFENGYYNSLIKNTGNENYIGLYLKNVYESNITENEASHNLQLYTYPDDDPKYTRGYGIKLESCANNLLKKNILSNNTDYGIYSSGFNNTFIENYFFDCGIGISGNINDLNSNNISKTNIINSYPVYFYKNKEKIDSNEILNPGQIILVNCSDSIIKNKVITAGSCGLYMYSCENITIENFYIYYQKDCGIKAEQSNYLYLANNHLNNYNIYGINLLYTSNSIILDNNITNNKIYGLFLENSGSNFISNNTIANNYHGLYLSESNSNNITRNYIINNSKYYENVEFPGAHVFGIGFYLYKSSFNNLINNTANNNYIGILLDQSNNNNVSQNIANKNIGYPVRRTGSGDWSGTGILLFAGDNNTIFKNILFKNTQFGMVIDDRIDELYNNNVTNNRFKDCGIDISQTIDNLHVNNIDSSNNIEGKPIYIYKNKTGLRPINFTNAGQINLVNCINSKISNFNITSGSVGISLFGCHNSTIESNNVTNQNLCGIYNDEYCSNITIFNNIVTQNAKYYSMVFIGGISSGGTNNNISKNNANDNNVYGIFIAGINYTISENTVDNCGLYVTPFYYFYMNQGLNHKIDISNTINGKPIYYYERINNLKPINFLNAGQVIIIDCNNSIISNLEISEVYTAISCYMCFNVTVSNNKISNTKFVGLQIEGGNNNIQNNNISNCKGIGLAFLGLNTTLRGNIINKINDVGLTAIPYFGFGILVMGYNCSIVDNQIINNNDCGILFTGSNNKIQLNNISNNQKNGIQAEVTYDNLITKNIIKNNKEIGIYLGGEFFSSPIGPTTPGITNNYIYLNDFSNNGLSAIDTGWNNNWDNGITGNYWDDYGGEDSDNNGIGDTKYQISGTRATFDRKPLFYTIFSDTDNDGLSNLEEYTLGSDNYRTSVINPDTDYDGLSDYWESIYLTNPWKNDTDLDKMPDLWEVNNSLNPLIGADNMTDSDLDLLLNLHEYLNGTDPWNPDTDNDTFLDGKEIELNTDPLKKYWYPMPNLEILDFKAKAANINEPFTLNFTIINNGIWRAENVTIRIKLELGDQTLWDNFGEPIDLEVNEIYNDLIQITSIETSGGLIMILELDPFNSINETYSLKNGNVRTDAEDNTVETELLIEGIPSNGGGFDIIWILLIIISAIIIVGTVTSIIALRPRIQRKLIFKRQIETAKIEIENFETNIRSFIKARLKDTYKSIWWESGVPKYIKSTIKDKVETLKLKTPEIQIDPIDFLDISQCSAIITYDDNWKQIFSKTFPNKEVVESNFENLRIIKRDLNEGTITSENLNNYPLYIHTIRNYFTKRLNVFLSYSTLDTEYFNVKYIVEKLEEFPEIDKVFFWEADSGENIVTYMERTLRLSKVFVLFCSNNALRSKAVEDEWQAAFQLRKKALMKIVPVYEDEDHIPFLLMPLLNVKFTKENMEEFIENLYKELIR